MRETEGADLEGVPCLERPAGRALRIPIERHPHIDLSLPVCPPGKSLSKRFIDARRQPLIGTFCLLQGYVRCSTFISFELEREHRIPVRLHRYDRRLQSRCHTSGNPIGIRMYLLCRTDTLEIPTQSRRASALRQGE